MKSNTLKHAEKEMDIRLETVPDAIIMEFKPEILAICEKFGTTGQSGGSSPYTAGALSQAIKKLCLHQPISPITGEESEWNDISNMAGGNPPFKEGIPVFQNNRCGAIFKDGKDGRAYYLDAIVFNGDITSTFTSNGSVKTAAGEKIISRQYIKEFPFKPKKFFIDVIETEWYKDKETGELTEKVGGGW